MQYGGALKKEKAAQNPRAGVTGTQGAAGAASSAREGRTRRCCAVSPSMAAATYRLPRKRVSAAANAGSTVASCATVSRLRTVSLRVGRPRQRHVRAVPAQRRSAIRPR